MHAISRWINLYNQRWVIFRHSLMCEHTSRIFYVGKNEEGVILCRRIVLNKMYVYAHSWWSSKFTGLSEYFHKSKPNDIRDDCIIWQMIHLPMTDVAVAAAAAAVVVDVAAAGVDVLVGYWHYYLVNCQKAPWPPDRRDFKIVFWGTIWFIHFNKLTTFHYIHST